MSAYQVVALLRYKNGETKEVRLPDGWTKDYWLEDFVVYAGAAGALICTRWFKRACITIRGLQVYDEN